jgi:hypothetical protein
MPPFITSFFANPALVGGALAGSIPVVIHLLNRQRFKKVVWAAMHWLWASYKKSQRRLQIEQLILLLIRILVLVLLAFALARPALQQGMGLIAGRASAHRVIVLDNSFSMGQQVGGHPLFDAAKDAAVELATNLALSDEVDVILANSGADEVIASSSLRKQDIANNIKAAMLSDGGTDIPKSIAAGCRILNERKTKNLRREIIVITDQTRAGWEDSNHQPRRVMGADEDAIAKAFEDPKSRPCVKIMRLAGEKENDNLAAVSVDIDEKVVPARVDTQILATVKNYSESTQKSVKVTLKIDGEEATSETLNNIDSHKTETVAFRHTFGEPGSHTVSIQLPNDTLPADNTAYLAVDVEDQIKVLCVDGQQRVKANESEMDYFRQALSPTKSEEVHAGRMPLLPEVIADSALAEANLDNYRLVVLADVAAIPAEKIVALEQFVKHGGALWIFVGEKVIPSLYNKELANLLPMDLGELTGTDKEDDPGEGLSDKEISHPAISKFKNIRGLKLNQLRSRRRFKLIPKTQADPSLRTVLAYETGDVAAAEKAVGEGRVMLFGTTANMAWNNWPGKNEYLPLMNYIALDLIQPAYVQRNRQVGERFVMQMPRQDLGAARHEGVRLIDPGGDASAMEVLTIESRLESAPIRKAGIYTAEIPGETRRTIHFAANRNPEESDLSTIDDREILAYVPHQGETASDRASYFKSILTQDDIELMPNDTKQVEESLKKSGGSREIWRWLAYTVLGLLLVESFLARRFGDFTR